MAVGCSASTCHLGRFWSQVFDNLERQLARPAVVFYAHNNYKTFESIQANAYSVFGSCGSSNLFWNAANGKQILWQGFCKIWLFSVFSWFSYPWDCWPVWQPSQLWIQHCFLRPLLSDSIQDQVDLLLAPMLLVPLLALLWLILWVHLPWPYPAASAWTTLTSLMPLLLRLLLPASWLLLHSLQLAPDSFSQLVSLLLQCQHHFSFRKHWNSSLFCRVIQK